MWVDRGIALKHLHGFQRQILKLAVWIMVF